MVHLDPICIPSAWLPSFNFRCVRTSHGKPLPVVVAYCLFHPFLVIYLPGSTCTPMSIRVIFIFTMVTHPTANIYFCYLCLF
ncbi:hypothetical protein FB446DRAFT_736559 [Lentinula raphanica]|nr:hypothetical protein FB446DRAFT_736559 [Lentinula raphanica]